MKTPYESIESVFTGVIGLGRELITDKDKLIEFEYKTKELQLRSMDSLLQTTTTPFVDATVKIIYAFVALMRPLGTAAMTAFGLYAHYKQIPIDTGVHAAIDGAFPAWGVSRHMNKTKEQEEKTKREETRALSNIPDYE
ncbi:MAG: hypothetical protein AB2765_14795 [Candidatus Thiodiazotropha endolucinida]